MKSLMAHFNKPWFVAGGWAIDLFIGRETRRHQDLDIAIFRKDQFHLRDYLHEWKFQKVYNGEFFTWEKEFLELPIHQLNAINPANGAQLEILLNEASNKEWRFRRDLSITLPLSYTWSVSDSGIPYLNPVIVLLYKAKTTRAKDHQDFLAVKDTLDAEQKKMASKCDPKAAART